MANVVKNGLTWVTASSMARNIVSILQISVLTRILDKSDFGALAIAGMFVAFTQLFLDMGISAGILHKQNITKNEYSSLFWLNIILGVFLTSLLYNVSPILTKQYDSDELNGIVQLLCFSIFVNSLGNQQRIVCQKNMYFMRLSLIEIITAIITFLVAIVTAYQGYGAYSIAYSTLAGLLFNNVTHLALGLIKDNRLGFHFSFSEIKPFLKIGVFSVGSQVLDFFTKELDIIIVSATLGLDFLGVYNVAKKIPLAIYRFITPIIQKVFTPLFAEMNNNNELLYMSYIKLSKIIAVYAMPLFFLLAAISPTIMNICFGNSFLEGSCVQSVFAIMYAFNSFMGICGTLQIATGRTDIGLIWTIFSVFITAVIFYTTSLFGVKVFLLGILLRILVEVVAIWIIQFKRLIKLSFRDYIGIFIKPFFISTILTIPFYLFFYKPSLIVSLIGTIIFFILYMYIICRTEYRSIIISTLRGVVK